MEDIIGHFHVEHTQSDNSYTAENLYAALLCAEDDLRQDVEMAHEQITASGELEDYETAYHYFKKWTLFDNILSSVRNVIHQHAERIESKRAPLFQGEGWESRLLATAENVVEQINSNTDIFIDPCTNYECEVDTD
jgi:hypothetical protein